MEEQSSKDMSEVLYKSHVFVFLGNSKLYNKLYGKYRLEFDQLKDSIDDKQIEQAKTSIQQKN